MPKIDCREKLKSPKGEDLKNAANDVWTVGTALAEILFSGDGNAAKQLGVGKCYSLAQKFFNDESVEVDDQDFDKIKSVLGQCETVPIVAGQLFQILTTNKKNDEHGNMGPNAQESN